ncbi:MAG: T9SS type A sorting domain-containing protein [candidate division KSB1 bacterium]|nr:T9SS type A sorting domain-containing protein [candidate division KSB1 bacterium]MDZ7367819.1 T9SS type A sorting domain-containing protein [candidate division KSB1 bacterium]MDZ7405495.1 T9SS type A sorting domain-containing protein [candidate division KSB1 bacterium]
MKWSLKFFLLVICCEVVQSQTYWDPDSTGYKYLSRGTNLHQWVATAGTTVEIDRNFFLTNGGAIKWTIPPNSGLVTLELRLIDVALDNHVIYTVCRRNNYGGEIETKLLTTAGNVYWLPMPVEYNDRGAHPPANAWHHRGASTWLYPYGESTSEDLRHVSKIIFMAENSDVEQILWIDEIKYTTPRGPACIIHFNHYRDSADSLLTPWLIQRGYRANIDFTYDFAKRRFAHNRANGGLIVRYVGLDRIAELVNKHGWSTTHHGTFYKDLRQLTQQERMQLYSLEPFTSAGFKSNWCFSIPMDWVTPQIFDEIQGLQRFRTIRNQWDKTPNELPIDNPARLRFYRVTSASAGPNLPGQPETLAQMRSRVDQAFKRKGLLIFNFETIVTAPSPNYKDVEFSMLSDDQALIEYADSLGFTFLTFQDLFEPDPNYKQQLSINHDYFRVISGRVDTLKVLQNDLFPRQRKLRISAIGNPRYGQAIVTNNRQAIVYMSKAKFSGIDRFEYIATDGVLSDTATVFITVPLDTAVEGRRNMPEQFSLHQNYPNPYGRPPLDATTFIRYALPVPSHVRLEIFDLHGRKIATVVEGPQSAGLKTVRYDARGVRSGVYFYKLTAGDFVETKKMIIMR